MKKKDDKKVTTEFQMSKSKAINKLYRQEVGLRFDHLNNRKKTGQMMNPTG